MLNKITLVVTFTNGLVFDKIMEPNNNECSRKDKNNAYKWQALLSKDIDIDNVKVILE